MSKKLFDFVHEVLSKQDTIVVPDFGAFVLEKTTTFLNDSEYISIIFTAQQQNDDGVLKNFIMSDAGISEEEAEEFMASSLEEVVEHINSNGIFSIEGIGEFRAINESIVFKPYDDQYLRKPSTITTPSPVVEEVIEETIVTEVPKAEEPIIASVPVVVEEASKPSVPITPPKPTKKLEPISIKKFSNHFIIVFVLGMLGVTLFLFRSELANLCKPTVTNDTTQVVTSENMQQLADTLADINSVDTSEQQSLPATPEYKEPTAVQAQHTIAASSNVILKGNGTNTVYYVAYVSTDAKQEAIAEKQNLETTGFNAKVVETTTGKRYHVVVAEFTDAASAKEDLSFNKKIDNQFYLLTVNPNK